MDELFVVELKLQRKKRKASHAELKLDFQLELKIAFELEFEVEFEWCFKLEFELEFELELELHFEVGLKLLSVVGKANSTLKSTQSVSPSIQSY